jgi:NAD(P)-dependent dehydrogenase (short-subunit alcohol dehydrogenase family)
MPNARLGPLLSDRVAVITGAGSGVGRATARLFAAHGAKVVCGDLRKPWVDDTVALVTEAGGQAIAVPCDVTVEADVQALIAEAVRTYGRLDIVYNNAGVATPGMKIEDHTDADWDRLMNVNLRGVFYGCKHAVLTFKAQGGGGVILNTSSVAGLVGFGGVVYGTTKGGVNHLTKTLAMEVASQGIRVNSICPGPMDTNLGKPEDQAFTESSAQTLENLGRLNPLGVCVLPEHIADAALFLASDMSALITGLALPVEGGYIVR